MAKQKLMCQVLVPCKSSVAHSKYVLDLNLVGRLGFGKVLAGGILGGGSLGFCLVGLS